MSKYLKNILEKKKNFNINKENKTLILKEMQKSWGYVYIAKSLSSPNLYKIGKTKKNPMERAKTLSNSGVVHDYQIVFSLDFFDCSLAECRAHQQLSKYRVKKEFFSISLEEAIKVLVKEHNNQKHILNKFIDTESFLIDQENLFLKNKLI